MRYPVPSGASSTAVTVSPKVDAHASKEESPCCSKVSRCRYRCIVYSSAIELLMGVPVANTTPRLPVISSKYRHFIYRSLARWLSV